jgi:hypothetical protein
MMLGKQSAKESGDIPQLSKQDQTDRILTAAVRLLSAMPAYFQNRQNNFASEFCRGEW